MADAASGGVPAVERAWSAEASVQPPANLGRVVATALTSSSKLDRQPSEAKTRGEAATVTRLRPAEIVVALESSSPHGSRVLNSPSFAASSPLSVLSAAASSLKDKTHQVAQQQKRALSAFQQKGGLVSWLHGDESDEQTSPTTLGTSSIAESSRRDELCTPPSPLSPIDSPVTIGSHGRRRSMPNIGSNSLLDNFFDRVAGASPSGAAQSLSLNSSPNTRIKLQPTVATVISSASSLDNGTRAESLTSRSKIPEIGRPRAATTDLPSRTIRANTGADSPAHYQARYICPPRPAETRFSLDDVLCDEWSCTVLWAHLYSSATGRDNQHHQRLSFLIETTFRITPLYRKLAGTNDTSDKENDFKKLIMRLKRLHSRFLKHNGTALANNGVPVASPAAIHAKNQLAVAVHTLTDQQTQSNNLTVDAQVEKAVSALFQLAREVEREFRVLGTRSYTNFVDSTIYRNFIAHRSGPSNIAALLRVARIPSYQQPSGVVGPVCLESLASGKNEDAATVFSRAECQVFIIAAQPNGSTKFTDISPSSNDESTAGQPQLLRTIEPFLNPSASVHPASSKPIAYNFTAGSDTKLLFGAVVWLPTDQNNRLTAEGIPGGFCIISKFPLVDSMRCFLNSLWNSNWGNIDVDAPDALVVQVVNASLIMGQHLITETHLDSNQLPIIDFRLDDLFDCLSLTHVLRLFAFALLEKKIVLVASSYTVLFSVSETLRALLHPLVWSHVYVPVLPLILKDCLQCPTPFIFGLHDSYVRRSDMPRPSNDLVVVNLDRDSVTGGGDIVLPPVRHSMMREELFHLFKPHLAFRDSVDSFDGEKFASKTFPTHAVRQVFRKHLREILASLEPCVNRFELNDQCVSVVDNINPSFWPADTARFCSTMLHTQAVSTYLASPRSDESTKPERIFV